MCNHTRVQVSGSINTDPINLKTIKQSMILIYKLKLQRKLTQKLCRTKIKPQE